MLVREIKTFNHKGNNGYVVAVVKKRGDQQFSHEANVSVGIKSKFGKSDLIAAVDVKMKDFSAISYLLFKHSTILSRR